MKPKVSVLMSVFNAQRFLHEALDSILNQTLEDFEFIVFEDASVDASFEIIRRYDDRRLRIARNETNKGLTANLNSTIDMARGDYLARMDADDIAKPNRLQQQVEYLDNSPGISVVGSNAQYFGDQDAITDLPLEHDEVKCSLFFSCTMVHPSVMIRKSDFDRHGLRYDPQYLRAQDYELWSRSSKVLRFANLKEPLVKIRSHGEQISKANASNQNRYADMVRKNQIISLGAELSDEELHSFHDCICGTNPQSMQELVSLEQALVKAVHTNRKKQIYSHSLFNNRLGLIWYYACAHHARQLSMASRLYWRSELSNYGGLSVRQRAKMLVGSLISYR